MEKSFVMFWAPRIRCIPVNYQHTIFCNWLKPLLYLFDRFSYISMSGVCVI